MKKTMHTGQLKQDMNDIVDGISCLDGGGTLMRLNEIVTRALEDDSHDGQTVLLIVGRFANLVRVAKGNKNTE